MAKFVIHDAELDGYVEKLSGLQQKDIIGRCVYDGAAIVADAIKANIQRLPVTNKRGTPDKPIDGVTPVQKAGLITGFGISHMKNENGFINVALGFNGYNRTISKTAKAAKWTSPYQANVMIARSVEKGTSFRKAHPFIAPAVKQTKTAAEAAMAATYDKIAKEKGF